MNVMENYLTIETQDGPMAAFVASLDHKEKVPVLILFQEAFGINHHIKDVCSRYAKEGYLVIAPELFHRQGKHVVVEYGDKPAMMEQLNEISNESLKSDIQATMHFLKTLPHADLNNVFTIGFCVGGFTSMLSATAVHLRGAISFYGAGVVRPRDGIGVKPFLSELKDATCPLLLFYGESDASIPESDRAAIRQELDLHHVPHELVVFGNSDHGFFCNERKSFNQKAASEAWKKSLQWLSERVGAGMLSSENLSAHPAKDILTHVPHSEER